MRRFLVLATMLLVLSVLMAACESSISTERGSGNVITETRDVSGFDEIVLLGSGSVTVAVTGTESLVIEAEDNIMPLLETEVRNGRLELGSKRRISPTRGVIYTVTAASLKGVAITGSGTVVVSDLEAAEFEVEITGSGNVAVVGMSEMLDISISGSGKYDGEDLVSSAGDVRISGSGSALVNVTDKLEISISGSGDVEYLGSPSLSVSQSGSGEVSARE